MSNFFKLALKCTTIFLLSASFLFASGGYSPLAIEVSAEEKKEAKTKALNTTGFTEKLDLKAVEKLASINDMVMSVGIILCVLFVVVGGITLASSGGNATKRGIGIAAIICAGVGVFVVFKAKDIAGWVIGI